MWESSSSGTRERYLFFDLRIPNCVLPVLVPLDVAPVVVTQIRTSRCGRARRTAERRSAHRTVPTMQNAMPGGLPDDMTPEQMMAMLQGLQAAGHNLDEISPDLSVRMGGLTVSAMPPHDTS